MSQPQAPLPQAPSQTADYAKALHYTALATAIACPLIAVLPPRKLDLLTLGLAGTGVYSTNYLLRESTGKSILQHLSGGGRPHLLVKDNVPSQPQLRVIGDVREHTQEALRRPKESTKAGIIEEIRDSQASKAWVAERDQEVQDALDVGKGFGDMITDQIWEVVNWGKKRDDDD